MPESPRVPCPACPLTSVGHAEYGLLAEALAHGAGGHAAVGACVTVLDVQDLEDPIGESDEPWEGGEGTCEVGRSSAGSCPAPLFQLELPPTSYFQALFII